MTSQTLAVALTWFSLGIVVSVVMGLFYLRPYVTRFLDEIHKLSVAVGEATDQIQDLKDELELTRIVQAKEIEKAEMKDLFGEEERQG